MAQGPYVVTGASKGIGRAISQKLAAEGHPVLALARSSKELDEIGEELAATCSGSLAIECDLSQPESIKNAAQLILQSAPWIAGIVHNAGTIFPIMPLAQVEIAHWSTSINANLIGVQDLTQRLLSNLGGKQQSRITTISSGAALSPVESWSAYCVAKAGLDMWARCLAAEGASSNISAISIAPGIVDTGMQSDIRSADPKLFPKHADFVSLYTEKHLTNSVDVADQLCPLILSHTMQQSGQRFDVREL